jgi:hypothetical protein
MMTKMVFHFLRIFFPNRLQRWCLKGDELNKLDAWNRAVEEDRKESLK